MRWGYDIGYFEHRQGTKQWIQYDLAGKKYYLLPEVEYQADGVVLEHTAFGCDIKLTSGRRLVG